MRGLANVEPFALTLWRFCLACAAQTLNGQNKDDALAKVLHAKGGVAIVPYNQQSEAVVGAVVARGLDGVLPIIRRATPDVPAAKDDEMVIPGDDMAKIKQVGLEAKVFAFDFGGKFNNYSTLSFETMKLTGKKIEYDDVLDLVKNGSKTDTILRSYVNPNPNHWGNINYSSELWVIGKVFTTTGVEITDTSGREITLQSGQTMPACPALPTDGITPEKRSAKDDKGGTPGGTAVAGAQQPDPAKPDPAKPDAAKPDAAKADAAKADATKDPKTGNSIAVDIAGVKVDASMGGASDNKSTTAIADKAKAGLKLDSPSGAVQVCVKEKSHVVLTTDHPIPIAMLVWSVSLKAALGEKHPTIATDTWKPEMDAPEFVLPK